MLQATIHKVFYERAHRAKSRHKSDDMDVECCVSITR